MVFVAGQELVSIHTQSFKVGLGSATPLHIPYSRRSSPLFHSTGVLNLTARPDASPPRWLVG